MNEMATATMSAGDASVFSSAEQPLFTCLSCSVGFLSAEEQRVHYRSDHHRYNMKRRVASLPPVSVAVFNQKVLERRAETSGVSSSKGSTCDICSKSYTTDNAFRSHMNSKKHKDNELKHAVRLAKSVFTGEPTEQIPIVVEESAVPAPKPVAMVADDGPTEEEINRAIDAKIEAARSLITPAHCLFCSHVSGNLEDNLNHMSTTHSFFVPDADYLTDLPGLITYLGEKIAIGNVCIYCNQKGREFRTVEAVRKHMLDKGHCKIAYDVDKDKLEISDYFDFSSSYPDAQLKKKSKKSQQAVIPENEDGDGWEDMEVNEGDEEETDEVVEMEESEEEESSDESLPDNQITYGDSPLELVLPSGARIGHRTMRRYYAQSFPGRGGKEDDPNSGKALVRRLLADKNSALVPRKGGYGAYGSGTEVVKARNRGEAREAGRHVKEFRDQKRREDFKTKVGFIHNSQKHYRDPLLQ